LEPPEARLELPEGQVSLSSCFYIERPPVESDCFEAIVRPGALIRVKAPRQMGKTSLMSRILHHAEDQGYRTVLLSFQEADGEIFADLNRFLQWFCVSIAEALHLPDQITERWQGVLDFKGKCKRYFQQYLLANIQSPLVLGLDEVDQVFQYPTIARDFFGMLRSWHERGKNEEIWQKLRLVLVHSKEPYTLLDIHQSPFSNVGLPIEPPEFTPPQVQDLAQKHGLNFCQEMLAQLMAMVGGHPYLVRVALYELARERLILANLLEKAPTDEGVYGDHLRRHLLNLKKDSGLLTIFKQILVVEHPVQIEVSEAFKLRSVGLVKFQANAVIPSCELYRQYFCARLLP
jgi:hypothetical protein